jgi:hypothetical protein
MPLQNDDRRLDRGIVHSVETSRQCCPANSAESVISALRRVRLR